MKIYGIIAAMQEEMQEIKKIMTEIEEKKVYELTFFKGKINDKNVVLVESGVGKVNAARTTQILIDITAFGHPKGFISNVGENVESDSKLIEIMEQTISKLQDEEFKIKVGTIASGDIFCTEKTMKDKIRTKFNADAIEMEGSAIAQVCKLDNIPFIVIRSISDNPNGNNNITFEQFLEKASKRCAQIIGEFFKQDALQI